MGPKCGIQTPGFQPTFIEIHLVNSSVVLPISSSLPTLRRQTRTRKLSKSGQVGQVKNQVQVAKWRVPRGRKCYHQLLDMSKRNTLVVVTARDEEFRSRMLFFSACVNE